MFKKALSLVLCALLVLVPLTACTENPNYDPNPKEKVTLVLDWTPNTNHTGLYAAQSLGYYADAGLELEIIQPPEDGALALVAAGRAHFAVSFQEEVSMACAASPALPIAAIAAMVEHNTCGIMSLKESGITRFKDLEGKRFATWQVPVYDEIVKACIIADGGDPDLVEFVPNSAMDAISGLRTEFDAIWVYEGWEKIIADVEGVEINFFTFRDIDPTFDYYTPVLVTSETLLTSQQDLIKRFLAATEKGYLYAKENPAEAAEILSAAAPEVSKEIIAASQAFLSAEYTSGERWGAFEEARWLGFFQWMREKELLPNEPVFSGLAILEW